MKKATKVLALILAMAMMACTLVACGSSADTASADAEATADHLQNRILSDGQPDIVSADASTADS